MKWIFHAVARVPKNVRAMAVTSFFNDVSTEMIYPILPFFLTSSLGVTADIIGLIEGIAAVTCNFLRIFSGIISDKMGKRKPFVLGGYIFSTFAKLLFGIAYAWQAVLFARFFDRFGKGVRTSAKDALVSLSTHDKIRGTAFGLDRALDNIGAVVGPLLAALLLFAIGAQYRLIFFLAAIPAVIGIIIFWWNVRDVPQLQETESVAIGKIDPRYRRFLLLIFVFSLGNSSDVFLMLRAKSLGVTPLYVVLGYALCNLVHAICAIPIGIITDRLGPHRVLIAGFSLYATLYFLLALVSHSGAFWLIFPLYGVFLALTVGVGKANVSLLIPADNAGIAFGLYEGVQGISVLFASMFAGFLWQYVDERAPFFLGATLATVAVIMAMVFHLQGPSQQNDGETPSGAL